MPDVFSLETIREADETRRANEAAPRQPFVIVHPAMLAAAREAGISFGDVRVHVSGQSCRRQLAPCEH